LPGGDTVSTGQTIVAFRVRFPAVVLRWAATVGSAMLFLYRPRQTWMPYRLPRERSQQDAYNRHLQESYAATRRAAAAVPAGDAAAPPLARDPISDLKELAKLHEAGHLSDAEFAAAKARVLGAEEHDS
jgi:hypothetical protein